MSSLKEEFINIYKNNIAREGSDKLLEWLETTFYWYEFFYSSI